MKEQQVKKGNKGTNCKKTCKKGGIFQYPNGKILLIVVSKCNELITVFLTNGNF